MDRIQELRDRVEALRSEIATLADADELTTDQEARLDAALTEHDEARDALAKAEAREAKLAEVREAAKRPGAIEAGSAPAFHRSHDNLHDLSELRHAETPELHERAKRFIGSSAGFASDEHRAAAESHLRDDPRGEKAKHMLTFGSDEYRQAFEDYMRDPVSGVPSALRTALSTTAANGGVMVPSPIDPTVILINAGAANPIRQLATTKTITVNTWKGVTSAGVTAEWTAEAAQVADASPTFAQPSISAVRADAYIQASMELVADSAVTGEISMLIADAKDRLEATAFWTGSGSTQPWGLLTRVSGGSYTVAGSSGAANAADLVQADVYALDNALEYRYKPGASFVAHRSTYNAIRKAASLASNNNTFWVDFGGGVPAKLIGYPTYEASGIDSTIVSGSTDDVLVLGDVRQGYYVVDRMGMSMLYNPLVMGANNRPTGEVGWVAFWRTGGDTVNSAAFRLLRL